MKTDENLRSRIMRRVYLIYVIRQIGQPVIRASIFAVTLLAPLSFVSLPHVIENVGSVSTVAGVIAFFVSAFLKTELFVQFTLSLAGLVAVWSVVDITKRLSAARPARAA